MTWTFDPRFTDPDNAYALEQAMLDAEMPKEPKQTAMDAHLARLAQKKSLLGRRLCTDCGLPLAVGCHKTRCLPCQANHRLRLQQERRVGQRTPSEIAKESGWANPQAVGGTSPADRS